METVQHAVQHRRQHQRRGHDEQQAGIQREQAGEQFAGIALRRIHRAHAAEQHGGVQKRVHRRQVFEADVAGHAERHREHQHAGRGQGVVEHAPRELAAGQRFLVARFIHAARSSQPAPHARTVGVELGTEQAHEHALFRNDLEAGD